MSHLAQSDPEIFAAIEGEEARQRDSIILIASENYTSHAVMEAQGSALTEKYAEGYPGRRYYAGCEFADVVEDLARERLKKLFGMEHANVQPHSGVQANMATYFAFVKPGDTILGMRLDQGGHLSHGSPVSFSGQYYRFVSYGVDRETEMIDYDEVESLAREHRPKIIVAGASSYSRAIDFANMRRIADSIDALLMVDMAHYAGLIAGGVYPDPAPYADIMTSTTQKTLRGPRGAFILSKQEHAAAIDRAVFPGAQGGPMMHTIAAKAVCFGEALKPSFSTYQEQVLRNARAMAAEMGEAGMRIVSGGTDCHLFLVDVTTLGTTGKDAADLLESIGVITNPNAIPFDELPPRVGSGIRIGTPAITSRNFGEDDARAVARLIVEVLRNPEDAATLDAARAQVRSLTGAHPIPQLFD